MMKLKDKLKQNVFRTRKLQKEIRMVTKTSIIKDGTVVKESTPNRKSNAEELKQP